MNLTATDGRFTISYRFNLTVLPINHPPVWSSVPDDRDLNEGDDFNYMVQATDEDVGDSITYGLDSYPDCGIKINASNGILIWTYVTAGTYSMNLTATDGRFEIQHIFNLTVIPAKHPPEWAQKPSDTQLSEDDDYDFTAKATDADGGDSITYDLRSSPVSGITMNSSSGVIHWANVASGKYSLNLTATDGQFKISHTFNLTVLAKNHSPSWASVPGDTEMKRGQDFRFNLKAVDKDSGDSISYALASIPPCNISVDGKSGAIVCSGARTGKFAINVSASDGSFTIYHLFNLTVNNLVPKIVKAAAPNNIEVEYNEPLNFSVNATDPDGDDLAYLWTENGKVLNTQSNFTSVFPPGNHTVMLVVTDGQLNVTRTYHFTVKPAPKPGGTKKGFIGGFEGLMAVAAIVLVLGGYYRKKNG